MTKTGPDATVLSTSQPERMGTVTDEMVEAAWAAIVGGDIAKTCFNASIIRADLKTGLAAALAATPAEDDAVLDSYADENQRLSDEIIALKAAAMPTVGGETQRAWNPGGNIAWQTVPLPATPEMIAAAERTDIEMRAQGFANAEPEAIYYAMLDAAPAVGGEALEEMRESGIVDAFEEADFAILYREVHISDTLQEITNVPQVFCREIARLIAQPASPLRGITDEMVERALAVKNLDQIQGFTYEKRLAIRDFRMDRGKELWSGPLGSHGEMMKRIAFIKMHAALEAAFSASPPEQPAAGNDHD